MVDLFQTALSFNIHSTADLAWGVEEGVLDVVDLQEALVDGSVEDPTLSEAISAYHLVRNDPRFQVHLRKTIAALLGDSKRAGLWKKVLPRLGRLNLRGPGKAMMISQNPLGESAQPFAGHSPAVPRKIQFVAPTGGSGSGGFNIDAREAKLKLLRTVLAEWRALIHPSTVLPDESLSLALPYGIGFRWNNGTVIEFGPATPEQVTEVLSIYRPEWFRDIPFEETLIDWKKESVRILLPEDLPKRLLYWSYRENMKTVDHSRRRYQLMQKRFMGVPLDRQEMEYLEGLKTLATGERQRWVRHFRFWTEFLKSQFSLSLEGALHSARSAGAKWDYLAQDFESEVAMHRKVGREPWSPVPVFGTVGNLFADAAHLYGVHSFQNQDMLEVDRQLEKFSLIDDLDVAVAVLDIFDNFISNAFRYTDERKPGGLKLKVRGEKLRGGSLMITVGDNGIGIQRENVMKIGSSHFRETRKEVAGSQGVGLWTVVEALRQYRSPLFIRSQEDRGTEFRILLPARILRTSEGKPVPSRQDESIDLLQAIQSSLEEGFHVSAASLKGRVLQAFVTLAERGNERAAQEIIEAARLKR